MAQQFNATLASQLVEFRGTSTVQIAVATPGYRAISGAVYSLRVYNGVSGTFGAHVTGRIGGNSAVYVLAGVTAITAIGNYVMYPVGYSSTGAQSAVGAEQVDIHAINRLDQIVPATAVVFQGAVATVGISTSAEVSMVGYANR